MAELKGSRTEANLYAAFSGEAMARTKYSFFASKAKKEGYEQISAYIEETSNNEKEHAEMWFKLLGGIGNTTENLVAAAAGENEEWTQMYKDFAKVAREEGFDDIAAQFEGVANIEREHETRFLALLKNIEDGKVFKRNEELKWKCRNCGHIHTGVDAPGVCPVCAHAQSYFEILAINY